MLLEILSDVSSGFLFVKKYLENKHSVNQLTAHWTYNLKLQLQCFTWPSYMIKKKKRGCYSLNDVIKFLPNNFKFYFKTRRLFLKANNLEKVFHKYITLTLLKNTVPKFTITASDLFAFTYLFIYLLQPNMPNRQHYLFLQIFLHYHWEDIWFCCTQNQMITA